MMKKYFAYGSNTNLKQMAFRCPTAKLVDIGILKGYRMYFNGVATIEPAEGGAMGAIWDIDEESERALDRYEGYPRLYRKETVTVETERFGPIECMVYIMNGGIPEEPSERYYETIRRGYDEVGIPWAFLARAMNYTHDKLNKIQ